MSDEKNIVARLRSGRRNYEPTTLADEIERQRLRAEAAL